MEKFVATYALLLWLINKFINNIYQYIIKGIQGMWQSDNSGANIAAAV